MLKKLFVVAALVAVGSMVGISTVSAVDNDQVCSPLDSGKIDTVGNPETVTVTAPEGMLIDSYCVKAGSENQGNGPVYVDVNPPVKTLTFGHPSGKDVSHYSVSYTPVPKDEPGKGAGGETPATPAAPVAPAASLPITGDSTPVIALIASAIATVTAVVSVIVKTALAKQL